MKHILWIIVIIFAILAIVFTALSIHEQLTFEEEQQIWEDIADQVIIFTPTENTTTPTTVPTTPTQSETTPSDGSSTTQPEPINPTEPATENTTVPSTAPTVQENNDSKRPTAINMTELKKKNADIVGWIYLENSNINYPILSSSGNEYLDKNIYGEYSKSGSIFTYDTQNFSSPDTMDQNLVIYGHNLKAGTMFSYINTIYKNPDLLESGYNKYIYIYNDNFIYKYQIYSVYKIEKDANFNQVSFKNDTELQRFIESTYSKSICNGVALPPNECNNILTLGTCPPSNSKTYRMVLHAVLVEVSNNAY